MSLTLCRASAGRCHHQRRHRGNSGRPGLSHVLSPTRNISNLLLRRRSLPRHSLPKALRQPKVPYLLNTRRKRRDTCQSCTFDRISLRPTTFRGLQPRQISCSELSLPLPHPLSLPRSLSISPCSEVDLSGSLSLPLCPTLELVTVMTSLRKLQQIWTKP